MRLRQATGAVLAFATMTVTVLGDTYRFTELPHPPVGVLAQNPAALADDGTVLSTVFTNAGAQLMEQRGGQSHLLSINIPGHTDLSPVAEDISWTHAIVGYCTDEFSTQSIGFLREPSGQLRTYSIPGHDFTSLFGVNAFGVSVGSTSTDGFSDSFPIIAHGNQAQIVHVPGLSSNSGFQDINDFGQILGFNTDPTTFETTQFLLDVWGLHPIHVPQNFSQLFLLHINNCGQAVGYGVSANDPTVQHGVIRNANGHVQIVDWHAHWEPTMDVTINGETVHLTFSSETGTTLLSIDDWGRVLASATGEYHGQFANGDPFIYLANKNGIGTPD